MAPAFAPLPFKPHRLIGLSERLIVSHYEANYGGALRRLNAIEERLANLDWQRTANFEINGLAREHLIALNSVILHEVYFDGLGGSGDPAGAMAEQDCAGISARSIAGARNSPPWARRSPVDRAG